MCVTFYKKQLAKLVCNINSHGEYGLNRIRRVFYRLFLKNSVKSVLHSASFIPP